MEKKEKVKRIGFMGKKKRKEKDGKLKENLNYLEKNEEKKEYLEKNLNYLYLLRFHFFKDVCFSK